jgi:flagellin
MSSTEAFTVSGNVSTSPKVGYFGANTSAASTLSKVSNISISTQAGAAASLGVIDTALTAVNSSRAKLGAVSNRLEMTVTNLTNIVTNLAAGRGRIEDADFAAESTELARTQILQQASMAMLSQANASKQSVMNLLQGR